MVFLSFFLVFFISVSSSLLVRDVLHTRAWAFVVRPSRSAVALVDLFRRLPQNLLAVGVKPHVPEAHLLHEALRLLQLALPPEERLDKLDA